MNTNGFTSNDIFFEGNDDIVGYVWKTNEERYGIRITNGEAELLYKAGISVGQAVKKLKNFSHDNPGRYRMDDAEFRILCTRFPWMEKYYIEITENVSAYLLAFMIFAVKEGWLETYDTIMKTANISEEYFKQREITRDTIIKIDAIKANNIVFSISDKGKMRQCGYSGEGEYACTERNFHRRITESAKEYLEDVKAQANQTKEEILNGEYNYTAAKFSCGVIAIQKKENYKLIFISREGDISFYYSDSLLEVLLEAIHSNHVFKKITTSGFNEYGLLKEIPQINASDRISKTYKQLSLTIAYLCGTASEDDCEELGKYDKNHVYSTDKMNDYYPSSIELIRFNALHPGFFHRYWTYNCRINIDGIEYQICWNPNTPELIYYTEYHHKVRCHLSNAQTEYIWKMTHASKDSSPIGKPGNM